MRKTKPKKRILLPDPKFGEIEVTRFVNNLMLQGKKSIAYSIFYDAIDIEGEKRKVPIRPIRYLEESARECHSSNKK